MKSTQPFDEWWGWEVMKFCKLLKSRINNNSNNIQQYRNWLRELFLFLAQKSVTPSPLVVRSFNKPSIFKSRIKTHLFQLGLPVAFLLAVSLWPGILKRDLNLANHQLIPLDNRNDAVEVHNYWQGRYSISFKKTNNGNAKPVHLKLQILI